MVEHADPIEHEEIHLLEAAEEDKLRLAALFDVSRAIAFSLDHRELLDRILSTTQRITGADVCTLRLLDESAATLNLAASAGLEWPSKPVKLGESIIGRAVLEKRPIPISEITSSPFAKPDFARQKGLASMLSVPLVVKDRAIGGFTVYHRKHCDYDAGDVKLLRVIASSAAVAIENSQLFRDTINTLVSLARAIEARDPYTQGHSERVTAYAAALAEECEVGPEDLMLIKKLGPMHDIGKVGVGDGLLGKPGPLTDDERLIMQRHPVIGETIISPIKLLQPGVHMVRHHHERVDGSGYPDGIGGQDLPISVRVITIADSYDAMTSKRPYRDALPMETAIAELRRHSGSQFDGDLVPPFIDLLERGAF